MINGWKGEMEYLLDFVEFGFDINFKEDVNFFKFFFFALEDALDFAFL